MTSYQKHSPSYNQQGPDLPGTIYTRPTWNYFAAYQGDKKHHRPSFRTRLITHFQLWFCFSWDIMASSDYVVTWLNSELNYKTRVATDTFDTHMFELTCVKDPFQSLRMVNQSSLNTRRASLSTLKANSSPKTCYAQTHFHCLPPSSSLGPFSTPLFQSYQQI